MIPKIIHQVWLNEGPIPEVFELFRKRCRKLHPDWEHKLWTYDNISEFYIDHYIARCTTASTKSNVIRLCALRKYGGVYADIDVLFTKSFMPLLRYSAFVGRQLEWVANGVMGAIPNHPYIERQIQQFDSFVDKPPPWGPELATLAIGPDNDVELLPEEFFYSTPWDKIPNPTTISSEAYALHFGWKSWGQDNRLPLIEEAVKTYYR